MWRRTTIRRDPLNSRESPSETELQTRTAPGRTITKPIRGRSGRVFQGCMTLNAFLVSNMFISSTHQYITLMSPLVSAFIIIDWLHCLIDSQTLTHGSERRSRVGFVTVSFHDSAQSGQVQVLVSSACARLCSLQCTAQACEGPQLIIDLSQSGSGSALTEATYM